MRDYRPHRRRLASALLVTVTVICASPIGLAQSDARLGTVYYQVLYADRQLRDLPKIPDTDKGIRGWKLCLLPAFFCIPLAAGGIFLYTTLLSDMMETVVHLDYI